MKRVKSSARAFCSDFLIPISLINRSDFLSFCFNSLICRKSVSAALVFLAITYYAIKEPNKRLFYGLWKNIVSYQNLPPKNKMNRFFNPVFKYKGYFIINAIVKLLFTSMTFVSISHTFVCCLSLVCHTFDTLCAD